MQSTYAKIPLENIQSGSKLFQHQASLPKLPVPALSDTLNKYLTTVKPLVSEAQYAQTKVVVTDFGRPGGQGEILQKRLEQRAEQTQSTSWLYEWWNDIAYMAYRDPVVINVNYFFQFRDDRFRRQQTVRAASLVQAAMQFRELVIRQEIEPEMARTTPLCSAQYNYLFNSCRIPQKPADVPATYDPTQHHHIAVLRKNQIYVFDVKDGSGNLLSSADIQFQLDRIMAMAGDQNAVPLGGLTTANRDQWTELREVLLANDPKNSSLLEKLQSAAFVLCLDDTNPVTREEVGRALWHGDGRNRWFDKSVQFIVFANGKAGFNGEHSMMDATPTGRMCEWMLHNLEKNKINHQVNVSQKDLLPYPEKLEFVLNSDVERGIQDALRKFDEIISAHELQVLAYDGYGKGLLKTFGVSPDAFVQMALQLAYYKMYGTSKPTYESAQTRKFAFGRTETGRSVSCESVAFVKAMEDPTISSADKVALCKAAIAYHGKYMKEASEGRGVDRHLLGLRLLVKPNEPKPSIFVDPSYSYSCHWNLSTSQLTSEYYDGYGWGEVVPDGYGLAYMIKENSIHVNMTSLKQGAERLRHFMIEALQDMRVAFEATMASSKPKSKL
jgi:carnitine O-acetyltransferase